MSSPQWAWELAREFRRRAGALDLFPFDLRSALTWAFDLTVEERPGLTVGFAARRLKAAGCVTPREKDRPLRACLVAHRGGGWVFLDADDPPDERRFSLAHELAHFLRHHWQPREKVAALGAVDAFDGRRAPDVGERLSAALHGVELRPYAHLMHRDPAYILPEVRAAEEEADALAIELLAPEEERLARLGGAGAEEVLVGVFGLPRGVARFHAPRLLPARNPVGGCRSPHGGGEL
jgi:hypothetical protein